MAVHEIRLNLASGGSDPAGFSRLSTFGGTGQIFAGGTYTNIGSNGQGVDLEVVNSFDSDFTQFTEVGIGDFPSEISVFGARADSPTLPQVIWKGFQPGQVVRLRHCMFYGLTTNRGGAVTIDGVTQESDGDNPQQTDHTTTADANGAVVVDFGYAGESNRIGWAGVIVTWDDSNTGGEPTPCIPETTVTQADGSLLASTSVTRTVTLAGDQIFTGSVSTDAQGVLPALDLSETVVEVDDVLVDRIEFTGTAPHMSAIEFTVAAVDIGGE